MDALVAIDKLDDFLHNAKLVPLSDAIRVDPDELRACIQDVRDGLTALLPAPDKSRSLPLVERMEEIARAAPGVPLSRYVRIDKERMYELLDQLRESVAEDVRPPGSVPLSPRLRGAIEALGELLQHGERPTVNPGTLSDAVVTLRGAVESELDGFHRSRALEVVGRVESVAAAAEPRRLSSRVRVEAGEIRALLDQLTVLAANP